jgi:hypothetical protein
MRTIFLFLSLLFVISVSGQELSVAIRVNEKPIDDWPVNATLVFGAEKYDVQYTPGKISLSNAQLKKIRQADSSFYLEFLYLNFIGDKEAILRKYRVPLTADGLRKRLVVDIYDSFTRADLEREGGVPNDRYHVDVKYILSPIQ